MLIDVMPTHSISAKTAIITGITGQIGSYLCSFLLQKGYYIYGMTRRETPKTISNNIKYIRTDYTNIDELLVTIDPDEIYHLAAETDATVSMNEPADTFAVNSNLVSIICETIKHHNLRGKIFLANSVEIFKGLKGSRVIKETSLEFYPKNPYGVAKLSAYWMGRSYRENHGLFIVNGIISNCESTLRRDTYVTKKVINAAKNYNPERPLSIGSLDSMCDWIHANDVAEAAWMTLQADVADDYLCCSGKNHSVRQLIELVYGNMNLAVKWEGVGFEEQGVIKTTGVVSVKVDPSLYRKYNSNEQELTYDNSKLRRLGWRMKYDLAGIINSMIDSER